jgi:acyl-coenzyme A thioesterase PaaI-like protein
MARLKKQERLNRLTEILSQDPFLTDEELSEELGVSIQTIRLDRMQLNIPELRERVRKVATDNYDKVKTLGRSEIVGELIDLELNKRGISVLETDEALAFEKTKIVKGHYIFAMAESLAMAVIDAHVALTGVANIKYRVPVIAGQKLVAKAELVRVRGSEYFIHIKITSNQDQVFRGKFILVALDGSEMES